MATQLATPPMEPDPSIRKRVCKACDRCRLKKSKCDGTTPCGRCKSDNAICVFGERKKSHDKIYPKGYVEMLEHQQMQLVNGLQELYKRVTAGQGWEGAPLNYSIGGRPLTHDILNSLGVLRQDSRSGCDDFDESPEATQQRLVGEGADLFRRRASLESDCDRKSSQTSFFEPSSHRSSLTSPFTASRIPTPPIQSPVNAQRFGQPTQAWQSTHKSTQVRPQSLQIHPGYTRWDAGMDPATLQTTNWVESPGAYDIQCRNGDRYTDFNNGDTNVAMHDWIEDDFNAFINPTMT